MDLVYLFNCSFISFDATSRLEVFLVSLVTVYLFAYCVGEISAANNITEFLP
jgi:hypothetical protein